MAIKSGRLKWYGLSFGLKQPSVESLSSRLESLCFLPDLDISHGFKIESVGNNYLSAKFISKTTIEQKISLPTGGEFFQSITDISTVDFVIEKYDSFYVRVENPPRSMLLLFNNIAQAFDYECSIEPVEVDVSAVLSLLKNGLDSVAVTYMDVSSISLGHGVQLRVAAAGDVGVEEELEILLAGKGSVIEGVKLKYIGDGEFRSVEITRRAGLKIIRAMPDVEFEVFRVALTQSRL
ncbi:hypothetical protein V2J97_16800 [Pseudomonas alliivorans]|nr:hypothetical protein [Pseudomonas alliivorans]